VIEPSRISATQEREGLNRLLEGKFSSGLNANAHQPIPDKRKAARIADA
jgi:hypothetical protein